MYKTREIMRKIYKLSEKNHPSQEENPLKCCSLKPCIFSTTLLRYTNGQRYRK